MEREYWPQVSTACWVYYLFLFHKLRIWHIVDDIFSEHWGRQDRVYFLGIDVFDLPVQDELIAFGSKIDCYFSAQKYECIDIAILLMSVSIPLNEPCRMSS